MTLGIIKHFSDKQKILCKVKLTTLVILRSKTQENDFYDGAIMIFMVDEE